MDSEGRARSKAQVVVKNTRTWTSGTVRFAVIAVEGHPERTYIALEKDLIGKPLVVGVQRFRLSLRDWNNLKRLIEIELPEKHGWLLQESGLSLVSTTHGDELTKLVEKNPELLGKILDSPNLTSLSSASFEYLNSLAMKVYKVQSKNVDLVLKNLSKASPEEFVQFATLLADLRLGQVTTLANLVKQKLEIIELFEKLTMGQGTREKEIHKLIENNPWIAHKNYEVVASDRQLADYLDRTVQEDPECRKRPDLIVKRVPHHDEIVLIELKRPSVKLRPSHVGQILEYKAMIQRFKPSTRSIDCYVFGFEKHESFTHDSKDATIRTFAELSSTLRDEYRAYLRVLEESAQNHEQDDAEDAADNSDIPSWLRG